LTGKADLNLIKIKNGLDACHRRYFSGETS
jgi:hypothetical protein